MPGPKERNSGSNASSGSLKNYDSQSHLGVSQEDQERIRRQLIAKFFRSQREQAGLSVEDVARALETNDSTMIIAYEAGAKAIPLEDVFALTNILNIDPEAILDLVHCTYNDESLVKK